MEIKFTVPKHKHKWTYLSITARIEIPSINHYKEPTIFTPDNSPLENIELANIKAQTLQLPNWYSRSTQATNTINTDKESGICIAAYSKDASLNYTKKQTKLQKIQQLKTWTEDGGQSQKNYRKSWLISNQILGESGTKTRKKQKQRQSSSEKTSKRWKTVDRKIGNWGKDEAYSDVVAMARMTPCVCTYYVRKLCYRGRRK